jgi:hypothetical protein
MRNESWRVSLTLTVAAVLGLAVAAGAGMPAGPEEVDLKGFTPCGDVSSAYVDQLQILTSGSVETTVCLAADRELTICVAASGLPCGGENAKFSVQIDGKDVGGPITATDECQEHCITAKLGSGEHRLGLKLTNGLCEGESNRHLYVDKVTLQGTK